jgi:acyl dehydratase
MLLYGTICRLLGTLFPGYGTTQFEQDLTFLNPVFAGEETMVLSWVSEIQREQQIAKVDAIIARPDGTVACQGKTLTYLSTNGHAKFNYKAAQAEAPKGEAMGNLYIGKEESIKRTFTREDLAERAKLIGDANPIYSDEDYARQTPFKRPLIPGDLLGGMISQLLGTRLPGPGTAWLKQGLVFPTPAYPDEQITATVEITKLRPEKGLVNLNTICTNPTGDIVCGGEGLVRVLVPE